MTQEAMREVIKSKEETTAASMLILLWNLLYEPNIIKPPQLKVIYCGEGLVFNWENVMSIKELSIKLGLSAIIYHVSLAPGSSLPDPEREEHLFRRLSPRSHLEKLFPFRHE